MINRKYSTLIPSFNPSSAFYRLNICLTCVFGCTRTEIFRTALGTTGSAATGDYQLADGRQGNLYHGPYPKPTDTDTGAGTVTVEATSAAPTGSTDDTVTISTPTAGPKTVTVQASSAATPDSNNDATTSVAPKTVTVGQDTGGQVPTSANTPLGASTTAKTGSVNGSNGQSVAREGIFTKGAKLAIVLTVASILMRLI